RWARSSTPSSWTNTFRAPRRGRSSTGARNATSSDPSASSGRSGGRRFETRDEFVRGLDLILREDRDAARAEQRGRDSLGRNARLAEGAVVDERASARRAAVLQNRD